jgi:hypothetical protein
MTTVYREGPPGFVTMILGAVASAYQKLPCCDHRLRRCRDHLNCCFRSDPRPAGRTSAGFAAAPRMAEEATMTAPDANHLVALIERLSPTVQPL